MKVAIYARYSSQNQRDASIADQLRVCREFAQRQGWHIEREYSDHAISGATLMRSGFQAFMAAAEGYGDHVTEVVGRRMLGSYGQIDEAVRRYRDGRHGEQALERLLGIELKVEQYQQARAFCARVSELTDEPTLARMWESAEALPSMPELEEPTLWLSRMT